jgi:uncharacterized RDD family membrane protein YckC
MSLAQVRIHFADGRVEDRWLPAGTFVVGRDSGDIVLGDPNASSRHAQIEVQPGRVVITDLGSTNGTLDPSGLRLAAPYSLQPTQFVRMGGSAIGLVQLAPAAAAAGGTQVMAQVPWQPPAAFAQAPQPPPPASPYGGPPGAGGYGAPPGMPGAPGYGPGMPAGQGGYGSGPAVAGGFGAPYAPGAAGAPIGAMLAPTQGEVATWASRAVGYLIDHLMVVAVMVVLDGIGIAVFFAIGAAGVGVAGANSDAGAAVLSGLSSGTCCVMLVAFPLAALGVGIWNRVHLVSKRGYSIGQGVMKLRVMDAGGRNLAFGTALIRLLAQVGLSMVPFASVLDLLWPLWDPQRQTLHDKAVGSFVVNDASRI